MAQEYELDVLLSLRHKAKDEAEDNVAAQIAHGHALQRAHQQAIATLDQARAARKAACARFDAKVAAQGINMGAMSQFDDYVKGLKAHEGDLDEAIVEAAQAVEAQQQVIDEAHATLIESVRELKAVESHHEAWLHEQRTIAQRKQGHAMDDIAARLWRENREH